MNIKNCRGRFKISADTAYECSKEIRKVMGMCSIVRVDFDCIENKLDYLAISPLFKEIPFGQRCPEYDWFINYNGDVECRELVEDAAQDLIKLKAAQENTDAFLSISDLRSNA